jgi:hypothetical protein
VHEAVPGVAMSPATSVQVRRRQAMRRDALERQRKLNAERRRRDEAEVDLAADFAVWHEECAAARDAVRAAESAMGRVVDRMIGELRVRYPRAAQLLEVTEDELRRLRQLAADPTSSSENGRTSGGDGKRAKSRAVTHEQPRLQHTGPGTVAAGGREAVTSMPPDSETLMAGRREDSTSNVDGASSEHDA